MVNKFAKNSDIKLLIEEKQITTAQIKRLIGKKGVFSLVRNSEELSNQVYPIFLGSYDIKCIQQMIQSSKNYQKSSIMTVTPMNEETTLDGFIDFINDELQTYRTRKTKYKVEDIVKDADGNLHISMTYSKKMRGKNELLRTKKKVLSIKIEKRNESKKLLVDVRQNDNTDLKEFEKFMKEINEIDPESKLFNVGLITLDSLTKENQIKFFDDLIACEYNNWKLEDIKGIDVKKYETQEDDVPDAEVTTDELAGINSAVFKGSSIRDTGIVKKFKDQGFYFISMKFKYSYINTWDSFVIDINFKGTTDGIKIDIVKTYEKDENDRDLINVLPPSSQEEIIVCFQNASYEIYKKLLDSQKKTI